jgi:hypothetical protein
MMTWVRIAMDGTTELSDDDNDLDTPMWQATLRWLYVKCWPRVLGIEQLRSSVPETLVDPCALPISYHSPRSPD